MSIFVVHKIGFFYTDECFETVKGANGSVVSQHDTLDAAKASKQESDVQTLRAAAGTNVVDFFFDSNRYNEISKELCSYYESEFGLEIEDDYFEFPKPIDATQAAVFLKILDLTFHNIVEYETADEICVSQFDDEIGEFGA